MLFQKCPKNLYIYSGNWYAFLLLFIIMSFLYIITHATNILSTDMMIIIWYMRLYNVKCCASLVLISFFMQSHKQTVPLSSGLLLGWMLLRVVESLAPCRPRDSSCTLWMDSRGRRSYKTQRLNFMPWMQNMKAVINKTESSPVSVLSYGREEAEWADSAVRVHSAHWQPWNPKERHTNRADETEPLGDLNTIPVKSSE